MKQFKEFGIKSKAESFVGDKIKIERILNREVIVLNYKIKDSKFEDYDKCLHLQIQIGENKHVVFSGSVNLIDTIQQIQQDEFPFKATIIKQNERLEFS